ncbi:SPOR domain-containing protein [Neolewinella litorea]|uniref:SPOR domain-containing protein n=1 Tax=Neolewinella litorea TaxID=2562452 RepID=A0A4S4NUS0_9BACT|nr:SPOR domain-containing protein [Neolewinella litorea]THH39990.1 hypothetical protein E4021_10320 [Neolewinella litorea]
MYRLLLLFFLPCFSGLLTAQTLFNVRVGTFQDVKADDFIDLRELGFVYGQPREGQLTDVYLGNYTSREKAETITSQLRDRGFRNAAVAPLAEQPAEEATFIQVALRSRNRSLDWRALEKAGKLFVDATDGVTKVVTGPYPNPEAANQALSDIRGLGYGDAFVRSIRRSTLIPVGTFETGIKKPLIPIELRQVPPTAPAAEAATDSSADAKPTSQPGVPVVADTQSSAATTPTPTPPATETRGEEPTGGSATAPLTPPVTRLPEIDGKTKRHSAAELQRVLKEKGFYDGSIDGYYGPGTTAAYRQAWEKMDGLRKYRILSEARNMAEAGAGLDWPELRLTATITEELAAGQRSQERAGEIADQRGQLLKASKPLDAATAARARGWETTVWKNLDSWAKEDPLHAAIVSALRVGYYQSQARLEALYQSRGLGPIEARDLATAALENLLGPDLYRFL